MDHLKGARNLAIILLIAAAVEFLPGGGSTANTLSAVLWVVFLAGLGYAGARLYREHRIGIYGLGDARRALLYGALAVGIVTASAKPRMWQTGSGEFAWFVLIGLAVYALIAVYRYSRTY